MVEFSKLSLFELSNLLWQKWKIMLQRFTSVPFYLKLFKNFGYARIALFLLLSMPTSGQHFLYYGWLSRLIFLSTSVFTVIVTWERLHPLYIVALAVFSVIRLVQRQIALRKMHKNLESINSLQDLKDMVLRGIPHPLQSRFITVRDGVKLHVQTLGAGKKLVVFGNGLGGRLLYFYPILQAFRKQNLYDEFTLVCWDYRGLFDSSTPSNICRMSIRDHTEDLAEILNALECDRMSAFIGWSTGVQIGLEFACLYPERVDKLVLLNGSHGHTLQAVFQPIIRVPWLGYIIHDALTVLRTKTTFLWNPTAQLLQKEWVRSFMRYCYIPYSLMYNTPSASWFLVQYLMDIVGVSAAHTSHYLRFFEELDCHSCLPSLRDIQTPTLIVTGMLDVLTPAYQSYEMARTMQNAQLVCFTFAGHFALFEYSEQLTHHVMKFLAIKSATNQTSSMPTPALLH